MASAAPIMDSADRTERVAGGLATPPAANRPLLSDSVLRAFARAGWTCLSVGLFAGIWEFLWLIGWADPRLLPPPHVFLSSFAEQAKFFNTATRWTIGVSG